MGQEDDFDIRVEPKVMHILISGNGTIWPYPRKSSKKSCHW